MAESHNLKKLKYEDKDVVAEVAIRDDQGNIISSTYIDKINDQLIDGQKDFKDRPRVEVEVPQPTPGRLPAGYTELDYIESTGTQYIDTGIVRDIDNNTYKLKLNVSYSNVNTRQLQGVQGYVYVGVVNGYWQYGSASNDHTNIQAIPNIFHSIELNANKTKSSFIYGKINNIDVVGGSQISNSPVNAHFCLFMLNGFNFPSSCKNKECELYENDILVRNFIPCINDQNEVGMYDTVSQTFFGNDGTGNFIAGPVIGPSPEPVYEYKKVLIEGDAPTITANNKKYSFTIKVVNNQPQLVYEEIE